MSSFSSISALAGLGQAAGQGEAFLNRFAQGQELVSQGLRRQQINAQVQQAEMDRELRLREIAAQQQSRAFSDILEAQSQERAASRQSRMDALREKEAELDLADREQRINERFQRQQAISQLPEEVQNLALAGFTGAATEMMKVQEKDVDTEIAKKLKVARDIQSALSSPDLEDEQRQQLSELLNRQATEIAELKQRQLQAKDVIQKSQPVKRGDAGPALGAALEQADQSAPLPFPERQEDLQEGKVYQSKRGPVIWRGDGFDPVEEVLPQQAQQGGRQSTLADLLRNRMGFAGGGF